MDILNTILIITVVTFFSEVELKHENSTEAVTEEEIVISDNFVINKSMSKVIWSGKALGIFRHKGTVDFSRASLQVSNGRVSGGTFMVDLKSITPTDNKLNPKEGSKYEKLKQHLSSDEFFDVEHFPTASYNLDTIIENNAFGTLTLHGKSNAEKIENIILSKEGEMIKIMGDLEFNRKMYDVSWDSRMKEKILAEDIKVEVMLLGN